VSFRGLRFQLLAGVCASLCVGGLAVLLAQQPQGQPAQAGRGGGRGGAAGSLFPLIDVDNDGSITRDELKAAFAKWLAVGDTGKTGAITAEQLGAVLNAAVPQPAAGPGRGFVAARQRSVSSGGR
jgi:hypothetical protein